MGTFSAIWTLLLVVPWASAGPVQITSCSAECRTPLSPKFRNAVGQTYAYQFDAHTVTSVLGTSSDKAVLDVKGQALLTFRGPCDVVLQLRQTSIAGLDDKVDSSELEKRPLLVSWQDGQVESICPQSDEPAWVVNIKRAVLSMLQHTSQFIDVSEKNVIESDVIGRCPTSYEIESSSDAGKSVDLIKTKVPNQCSLRVDRHSAIPSVQYITGAETQSLPLLNSTSVCKQHIKQGIMESVECRESHLFRPLSTENGGGAKTEVVSSLRLISTSAAPAIKIAGDYSKHRSLIFDASGHFEPRGVREIGVIVKTLCTQLASESQAPVSQLFTELVYALRKASPKEVKAAYANLQGKKNCPEMPKTEKMFLDALPQAGSTGSISLMVEILKDQKVSRRQALGWYMSMPLSKFLSADSVKAVLPLVDSVADSPVALLSISGLARRFCIDSEVDCNLVPEVLQLSDKLGKLLGNKCQEKDELRAVSALKAIGNLGVMNSEVLRTVNICIKDTKLPISTRLAAIEASRNSPCIKSVKEILLNILADKEEDNEVRIAAYLGIMRCPCSITLGRVQEILSTEEFNQVGGFIVSHLNNLKHSRVPGKEHIRRLVNKMSVDRSFAFDLRKYSRNLGHNYFCSVNNVGWELDANVIYSTKSFLPRSASLNLTVDLFGQSFNLFELGARVENVERLLEAYLGPDGSIQKAGLSGLLEKGSSIFDNAKEAASSMIRNKRATIKSSDLNAIDKMVDLKDMNSGVKLDAFVRLLGTEVAMLGYRGAADQKRLGLLEGAQEKLGQALRDLLEGAKKVDIDVARSVMFLDSAATFPTIAGVPIKLAVNGTTTLGLGLESKMDIPALLRDPRNADIKLKINPLAVTELSAAMSIDMVVAKSGVKMVATIHSSAAADLSAKLVQGSSFDFKLDLPKTKISVVEIKSELLLVQQKENEVERTKKMAVDNETTYSHGGCSERLSAFTGIRACAQSSVSIVRPTDCASDRAPMFPLSGHGQMSFVIEKTDANMRGYSLSAEAKAEGPKSRSLVVIIDTPGSSTARKITFKGKLVGEPDVKIELDAKTPWGAVNVESELVNRPEVKSLMMKLSQESNIYMTKMQLNVDRSSPRATYSSQVEIQTPSQPRAVVLEGNFGWAPGTAMDIKLKPAGPWASRPFGIEATLRRDNRWTKINIENLEVTTPLGKWALISELSRSQEAYSASVDMKYGPEKQHKIGLNAQIQKLPSTSQVTNTHAYKTSVSYKSSRFPVSNMDIKWEIQWAPSVMSNSLVLVHGPESEQSTNRLSISQFSSNKGKILRDMNSENKIEVTYPRYNVNLKLEQQLRFDDRNIKGIALLTLSNERIVDGDISIVFKPKDAKTLYEVDAKLAIPGRSIKLTDVGKRIDDQSFTISPSLNMQPGGKHDLTGRVSLLRDPQGMSMTVDSELRIEGLRSPIKLRHSFQMTDDMTITTSNKLEWDGQPQMAIDGKAFLRAAVPAVELAVQWNGRFDGKLSSRLSRRDAKLDLDVKFLRFDRRVKVNGVFKNTDESKVASFSAAWDADKDASKQISLELALASRESPKSAELKSSLSLLKSRYAILANYKLDGDRKSEARVELEMPESQKLSLNLVHDSENSETNSRDKFNADLTIPSGQNYKLAYTTAKDFNENKGRPGRAELLLKTPQLDQITITYDNKANGALTSDNKVTILAPKFNKNIEASIHTEDKTGIWIMNSLIKSVSDGISMETNLKVNTAGPKTIWDGSMEIKMPSSSWKQIKIVPQVSYEITSPVNFDLAEKVTITYENSKTIVWDLKSKMTPSSLELNAMLETPYQVARRQSLSVNGRLDKVTPKYEGSVVATWSSPDKRETQKASLEVEVERRVGQSIVIKINMATPLSRYENNQLRFDGRRLNEGKTWEGDLTADMSGRKYELKGKVNIDPKQPELELTLTRPSENPVSFFVRVQTQSSPKTIETRVDWGRGTIAVNGKAKVTDLNNFEIVLTADSPALGVESVELILSNKINNKNRKMEATIKKKSVQMATLRSSYELSESQNGFQLKGNAELSVQEPSIGGIIKFNAAKKEISRSDEKGSEYKLELESNSQQVGIAKIESNLKMTNREKSAVLGSCNFNGHCEEASFLFKDSSAGSKSAHDGSILMKSKHGKEEVARGLRYKYLATPNKFEQSTELLFGPEEERMIGYKIYKEANEYGVELFTPKRKAGFTFEQAKVKQQTKNTLSVWMDKTGAANNKLTIVTTVEPNKLGDMEGVATTTVIRHPALPRDLEYKLDYHLAKRDTSYNRFHVKLDLDVSDSKHQRWTVESFVRGKLNDKTSRNVTIETEIRSKGTDLSALLILSGSVSEESLGLDADLKLQDKGRVEKELFASLNATRHSASLAIGSPAKHLAFEGRWNMESIVGHPRVQFTGYTKVFNLEPLAYVVDMSTAPHVDIRVFHKATPEKHYHIRADLLDDSKFEVVLGHQTGAQRKDLVAAYLTLNSSTLLHSRLSWDLEEIRSLLNQVVLRSESVRSQVKSALEPLGAELKPILAKWKIEGDLAKKGISEFVAYLKQRAQALKQEVAKDQSLQMVVHLIDSISQLVQDAKTVLERVDLHLDLDELCTELIRFARLITEEMAEYRRVAAEKLRARVEKLGQLIRVWAEELARSDETVRKIRDFAIDASRRVQTLVQQLQLNAESRYERIAAWLDSLNVVDQRVIELLKKIMSADGRVAIRQRVAELVELEIMEPVIGYLKSVAQRYPETKRIVCRMESRMEKLRKYVRNLKEKNDLSVESTKNSSDRKELLKKVIGEVIVFDVQKGEIQYQLPLYRKISSLRQLPDLLKIGSWSVDWVKDSESKSEYNTLADKFFQMRAKYDPSLMQSRVRGFASVLKNGYVTFDKKAFEMNVNSNCQYLLARDMLNKDFTLAVNYEESAGKTIIFNDQEDQVEIKNKQVLVNQRPASLPVNLKNIRVQMEDGVVVVKRSHGVVLRCDLENDTCNLDLNPFYTGRVMGLLGTFTNEAADDLKLPIGKLAKDINVFVNSWKLNKVCKDKESRITVLPEAVKSWEKSAKEAEICSELFQEESSPLRSCFGVIKAKPYYELCVKSAVEAKKSGANREQLAASSSAAYIAACQRSGVANLAAPAL